MGLSPLSVTGDAAYGTKGNTAAIGKASIRAYTALAEQVKRVGLWAGVNVEKRRLRPQKVLRIYRRSVKMGASTRIRVCADEKGKPVVRRGRKA